MASEYELKSKRNVQDAQSVQSADLSVSRSQKKANECLSFKRNCREMIGVEDSFRVSQMTKSQRRLYIALGTFSLVVVLITFGTGIGAYVRFRDITTGSIAPPASLSNRTLVDVQFLQAPTIVCPEGYEDAITVEQEELPESCISSSGFFTFDESVCKDTSLTQIPSQEARVVRRFRTDGKDTANFLVCAKYLKEDFSLLRNAPSVASPECGDGLKACYDLTVRKVVWCVPQEERCPYTMLQRDGYPYTASDIDYECQKGYCGQCVLTELVVDQIFDRANGRATYPELSADEKILLGYVDLATYIKAHYDIEQDIAFSPPRKIGAYYRKACFPFAFRDLVLEMNTQDGRDKRVVNLGAQQGVVAIGIIVFILGLFFALAGALLFFRKNPIPCCLTSDNIDKNYRAYVYKRNAFAFLMHFAAMVLAASAVDRIRLTIQETERTIEFNAPPDACARIATNELTVEESADYAVDVIRYVCDELVYMRDILSADQGMCYANLVYVLVMIVYFAWRGLRVCKPEEFAGAASANSASERKYQEQDQEGGQRERQSDQREEYPGMHDVQSEGVVSGAD